MGAVAAKRTLNYRIDSQLADAVRAMAEMRGESVTDIVVRAFKAYIDAEPAPRKPKGTRRDPPDPVKGTSGCPHPRARILKGLCHACGSYVGG